MALYSNLPEKLYDTALGKIHRLAVSIKYYKENVEPHLHTMEAWERKEFEYVQKKRLEDHAYLVNYISSNEATFNALLVENNIFMSVAIFIAKYA